MDLLRYRAELIRPTLAEINILLMQLDLRDDRFEAFLAESLAVLRETGRKPIITRWTLIIGSVLSIVGLIGQKLDGFKFEFQEEAHRLQEYIALDDGQLMDAISSKLNLLESIYLFGQFTSDEVWLSKFEYEPDSRASLFRLLVGKPGVLPFQYKSEYWRVWLTQKRFSRDGVLPQGIIVTLGEYSSEDLFTYFRTVELMMMSLCAGGSEA